MAQPELIKDIEARVKDTGDIMTGNLKVPDLDIASDLCRGYIYGETNSLNFRGGNPTTEKYTHLKITEDGAYIDNQKIYYPGNKPTPADIGAAPASHVNDTTVHVTDEERSTWNAKADAPFKPAGKSYLTFSSPNSFTIAVGDATKHWNGTLEYFSSDKVWTTWNGTTTLSSVDNDGDHVLYLRGTGNTIITGSGNNSYRWVLTGTDISCIGNIENLLNYATVESGAHPTMARNCYFSMFRNCTSLTQAPALPATTLTEECYRFMFVDCTSLTQAPALPATTLVNSCYSGMFRNCTSLTQAPVLPATTLADYCYANMFSGCTGLTQAPALPATTLTQGCYDSMFIGCTSLKLSTAQTGEYTQEYRIPSSGTGTTADYALDSMFAGTGGTFTGTPEINTTYYLSSENMVVRETEIATLNGYVSSMIDAAQKLKVISITLSATSWDSSTKTQTVTVSGVLADETKQLITPAPALASQTAYYEAVVLCTGQAANQLTFTAKKIPTADLTVYVTIQEVSA